MSGDSSPATLREALEAALVENPDDLAAHRAYADHLMEQGDPRGEFIQVQLALEDTSRPAAERRQLQQREQELFRSHGREWLSELAPYLLDQRDMEWLSQYNEVCYRFQLARGWLDTLEIRYLNRDVSHIFAQAPQLRLLRQLLVEDATPEEAGPPVLSPFHAGGVLANVRIVRFGEPVDERHHGFNCTAVVRGVPQMVAHMPRLEELYLLAHQRDEDIAALFALQSLGRLRVLQVYHLHHYPLELLAANPTLTNLTHLLVHPGRAEDERADIRLEHVCALVRSPHLPRLTHLQVRLCDMGDEGCEEIVRSGILRRLKVLDLQHGLITDEGAKMLAACPDLPDLERLDLSDNALTDEGIELLQGTGVRLVANNQHDLDDDEWRYQADIE
jgi:uncharacterized protein (TIGR02996 family)